VASTVSLDTFNLFNTRHLPYHPVGPVYAAS
jgi:hypothetical protein